MYITYVYVSVCVHLSIETARKLEREGGREKVTRCFTPSKPGWLYQGEQDRQRELKSTTVYIYEEPSLSTITHDRLD